MPELDWDGIDAMDRAIDSPVHARDSIDDEDLFIDTSRTGLAVTTRHVLMDGDPGPDTIKLITLIRRAPAATQDALQKALTGAYSDAVADTGPIRHEALIGVGD